MLFFYDALNCQWSGPFSKVLTKSPDFFHIQRLYVYAQRPHYRLRQRQGYVDTMLAPVVPAHPMLAQTI
jgi:hypothetical protein